MKLQSAFASVLTGILMVGCAATGDAQAQQTPGSSFLFGASAKSSQYAGMARGATLTKDGLSYVVLPDVRAQLAPTDGDAAGLDVVERRGPFVVYRTAAAPKAAVSSRAVSLAKPGISGAPVLSRAIVLNPRTGGIGIVLGTIRAKLVNLNDAPAVAAAAGLTLTDRFDAVGLAYFAVPAGADIEAAVETLRADARVTSADPEILEQVRRPN